MFINNKQKMMDRITLTNLGIDKDVMNTDMHIENPLVFDKIVMNSPNEYALGKTYIFGDIKPGKEKFTKLLCNNYSLKLVSQVNSLKDLINGCDCLYLKEGSITPKNFLSFLRNCLAHRNIFKIGNKMFLFHFDCNSNKPGINKVWDLELTIVLCIESIDGFVNLIEFYDSLK